jgi:hypothetical protein
MESPTEKSKHNKDHHHKDVSIMELLKNAIGLDLTKFTVPVSYNEPTTFLQRMMEVSFHHIYLLDKANMVVASDPDLALLYVAVYSLSVFSSGVQRVGHKPFNPLLGETYEFQHQGIKFISEQVSHHPPIGASFIESEHFAIHFYLGVETKFTGNSVYSKPFATSLVTLKATGAQYVYEGITSAAHNVLIGSRWVDIYGKVKITELNSKRYCKMDCLQCDFFSTTWHHVTGECHDEDKVTFSFEGEWNHKIHATRLGKQGHPELPYEKNYVQYDWLEDPNKEIPEFTLDESVLIWKKSCSLAIEKPYTNWDMTNLACEAIKFDEKYYITHPEPPQTDSRQRADRIALEKLDFDTAASEKEKLENKQRKERHEREEQKTEWVPSFFEEAEIEGLKYYRYKHNYPDNNSK